MRYVTDALFMACGLPLHPVLLGLVYVYPLTCAMRFKYLNMQLVI